MRPLIEARVRARARSGAEKAGLSPRQQLALRARAEKSSYDVFLSQALKDEELVLGIYTILVEDLGLSVFCDWVESPLNTHANTTPSDAAYIKEKMMASNGLVFIDSDGAGTSTWMSWEIGWFHGAKGRVCVLPILKDEEDVYRGREFLGLYPTIQEDDRHVMQVSVPFTRVAMRHEAGAPIGIVTRIPLKIWCSVSELPSPFRV